MHIIWIADQCLIKLDITEFVNKFSTTGNIARVVSNCRYYNVHDLNIIFKSHVYLFSTQLGYTTDSNNTSVLRF